MKIFNKKQHQISININGKQLNVSPNSTSDSFRITNLGLNQVKLLASKYELVFSNNDEKDKLRSSGIRFTEHRVTPPKQDMIEIHKEVIEEVKSNIDEDPTTTSDVTCEVTEEPTVSEEVAEVSEIEE